MIFSLSGWFSLSEKEKNPTDVHVKPPVTRTQQQRKRKHQQIPSKDCLDEEDHTSGNSDTSKYDAFQFYVSVFVPVDEKLFPPN